MDREKVIKGIEECDLNGGLIGNCPYKGILSLLKEQEDTIIELQNAYNYLQTQFFEAQDKLLKEQEEHKTGKWEVKPSNKEQGERDFIWWKCSECGQVIYSESEHDRKEFHKYCGRCGAKMT